MTVLRELDININKVMNVLVNVQENKLNQNQDMNVIMNVNSI